MQYFVTYRMWSYPQVTIVYIYVDIVYSCASRYVLGENRRETKLINSHFKFLKGQSHENQCGL